MAGRFHPLGFHRLFPHALEAFHEHVEADDAQHDDVGDLDDEVGIAHGPEHLDELYAHGAPEHAADDEEEPHLEVHVPQAVVGIGSGGGGRHDLVGVRGRGHRGRNPHHDQERRHEKAAPDPEQPGEEAHGPPQAKEKQDVDAVTSQW